MQDEILRLKREKDICILAHSYQAHEILEVADFVGDSFQLSVQAAKAQAGTMLMCGVRFMAETGKILSPEKRVLLSVEDAGCPMAEQMDKSLIAHLREKYPSYTVVAYINTTAELKTVCDVCVTSSSAVKIVGRLASDDILFIPDCNLGAYVKEQLPEKNIMLLQGGCPVHAAVTGEEARGGSSIPNAGGRCWRTPILSARRARLWTLRKRAIRRISSSAPNCRLPSICSLHVRTSASTRCRKSSTARICA